LIRGVADYVRRHGPWSIHFTPHGLREPFSAWLRSWDGDGILARIDDRRMARLFRVKKLPLIDLRGRLPDLGIPIVGLDNRPVARLAFEHLRQRGFRHYGFCGMPPGEHVHLDQRREFFVEEVRRAGFHCHVYPARRMSKAGSRTQSEQDRLEAWLRSLPLPIGMMCCNDDRGRQLLDACRTTNLRVPDQIAVVGVDNDEELCNLSSPALSSVSVNAERIGYAAAEWLDRMMAGRKFPDRDVLFSPTHVVTRQSTDTVAVEDPVLARALQFIRDHSGESIDVDDVVEAAGVSRRFLERLMANRLGRSPNRELIRVRIDRARSILLETDSPMSVVARRCGFRNAKYFGDAFRRVAGMAPGEFRRRAALSQNQD
jgi:LacI family transcriptional regulator